jgi:hypothetical protein
MKKQKQKQTFNHQPIFPAGSCRVVSCRVVSCRWSCRWSCRVVGVLFCSRGTELSMDDRRVSVLTSVISSNQNDIVASSARMTKASVMTRTAHTTHTTHTTRHTRHDTAHDTRT